MTSSCDLSKSCGCKVLHDCRANKATQFPEVKDILTSLRDIDVIPVPSPQPSLSKESSYTQTPLDSITFRDQASSVASFNFSETLENIVREYSVSPRTRVSAKKPKQWPDLQKE